MSVDSELQQYGFYRSDKLVLKKLNSLQIIEHLAFSALERSVEAMFFIVDEKLVPAWEYLNNKLVVYDPKVQAFINDM